jgi:1-phosphofructokinase
MRIEKLVGGQVNRSSYEKIFVGGKGINVSTVLKELGYDSTALGFIAGFTGLRIREEILATGCIDGFIELENGTSRINVKLKGEAETEINGQGPEISRENIEQLFEKLKMLKDGDVLVLAGNAPASMGKEIYRDLLKCISGRNVITVVDATGDVLLKAIEQKPFIIKPNIYELGEIFNVTITEIEEVIFYAEKLRNLGAQNVMVSMDERGGVIITENGEYYCKAKDITAVNSTGAGDSMVAGFIAKYLETKNLKEAFEFGIAAGTAAASCEGLPNIETILKMFKK